MHGGNRYTFVVTQIDNETIEGDGITIDLQDVQILQVRTIDGWKALEAAGTTAEVLRWTIILGPILLLIVALAFG